MFTVEEVSENLGVSKVTIYAKLKKFNDKVVTKQGKKYITDDLLTLIKQDLKAKDIETDNLNFNNGKNGSNEEIAMDNVDLANLNKDLINSLLEQLKQKDKQIDELHKLLENSQVLLKERTEQEPLLLEEQFQELNNKMENIKESMNKRAAEVKTNSFWDKFKSRRD